MVILRNAWEAESARILFEQVSKHLNIILVGSDILRLEAARAPDQQKKFWISSLIALCKEWVVGDEKLSTYTIKRIIESLYHSNIKAIN